jgi:hypothetical protein
MTTEVKRTIDPDDIEWEMGWTGLKADGSRMFPDKPEKEMVFEAEDALALLLLNEVIHINDHWWEKEWPEEARRRIHFGVNCSDVFAWGCADSESLDYKDIESLYRMWAKDPVYGHEIWCIIKRRELPQDCVEKSIRNAGIWDLDALKAEHNLRNNHYSGVSIVLAQRKYSTYCDWEKSVGREPRAFDANWWNGWNEYTTANPGWNSEEWKAADTAACEQWRLENGFSS